MEKPAPSPAPSETRNEAETELELSEQRTELSAKRTRDALERTLMSWIRTALNMIGYGFGLFKILQYMLDAEDGSAAPHPGSDVLATTLVCLGTLLLIAAAVQYRTATRALEREHGVEERLPLPLLGAAGVALIGIFALTNLLTTVLS